MAVNIQLRRGTAAEWTSANPTLAEGELGIETDTNKFKVGNGADDWDTRPYGALGGTVTVSDITDLTVTATEINRLDGVTSDVQTQIDDLKLADFVTSATSSRTLTSSDAGKTIRFTSGSATTVTVNASTDFPVGARSDLIADGAGELTVEADGATVAGAETSTTSGSFTIGGQYSAATLLCVATDEYRLIGNITAS